jgi:hypothetical protein
MTIPVYKVKGHAPIRYVVFHRPISEGYQFDTENQGWYHHQIEELTDDERKAFLSTFEGASLSSILKKKTEKKRGGVCHFAIRHEGKTLAQAHVYISAPCHASFRSYSADNIEEAVTYIAPYLSEEMKEGSRELYSWIMNGSPWMHCMHPSLLMLEPKERTDMALNDPVPVNVNAPANEVAGFAVAHRVPSEHDSVIPTFKALREKGLSVAQAFLMSSFVIHSNNGWTIWHNTNWHHFLSVSQSLKDVIYFFKFGYFNKERNTSLFKDSGYTFIAGQISGEVGPGKGSIIEFLKGFSELKGDGWDANEVLDIDKALESFKEVWNDVREK